jgi:branched-chain amino acid transport system ATP-binding protein
LLKLTSVYASYGHIQALRGINLEVGEGEIVSLVGANGAGKTTTLRVISRLMPCTGEVVYQNEPINHLQPNQVVKKRLIHCPENRQIFPQLTVYENLLIGTYTRKDKQQVEKDFERVFGYFPRLKERLSQFGGTLSGGEQQMLAIGRALMGNPRLLLLDEPSLGLAPIIIREIFDIIQTIRHDGTSILLVEQNVNMALHISDRAYILENGRVALSGKAEELQNNDRVRQLYLGIRD